MTDQEKQRYIIQQRLIAQQGRMSRAVVNQIMDLIDKMVKDAKCKDCKCKGGE